MTQEKRLSAYHAYNFCLIRNKIIPEYESVILTDPFYSYLYALNIIKDRWPEAESIIKQNEDLWHNYCSYFNIKKNKCNWKVGL